MVETGRVFFAGRVLSYQTPTHRHGAGGGCDWRREASGERCFSAFVVRAFVLRASFVYSTFVLRHSF